MTNNQELFKELDRTAISQVKIGNGDYIDVKGKGIVVLNSLSALKYISDVLYVPDIDQNLLSVGQLMEKGSKVMFEDQWCLIKDNLGNNVFKVKMKSKGFTLNLMEKKQSMFSAKTCSDKLWHKRVGHFHHAGLMYIYTKTYSCKRSTTTGEQISKLCSMSIWKAGQKTFPSCNLESNTKTSAGTYRRWRSSEYSFTEWQQILYHLH